eukprot:240972_1
MISAKKACIKIKNDTRYNNCCRSFLILMLLAGLIWTFVVPTSSTNQFPDAKLDEFDGWGLMRIFALVFIGFLGCIYIFAKLIDPEWPDMGNTVAIFGNPINYHQVIRENNMYINHFRAKLRRTSIGCNTNYNRLWSMWTVTKICLISWMICDLINLVYVNTTNTTIPVSQKTLFIFWYVFTISIHGLCLYGLYICHPFFIRMEKIVSYMQIMVNFYMILQYSCYFTWLIYAPQWPLIIQGIFTIYLFKHVFKFAKWYRYQKDCVKKKDEIEQNMTQTDSVMVAEGYGPINISETTKGVIECKASKESKFPTVIARCNLNAGKWYYEIKLNNGNKKKVHIGWCLTERSERFSCAKEIGTGNTKDSWAYNPWNKTKCHNWLDTGYGTREKKWNNDDIIGCYLDLDNKMMRFSRNGVRMSVAFTNFMGDADQITPSVSIANNASVTIYLNETEFKYAPKGYNAVSKAFDPKFVVENTNTLPQLYPNDSKDIKYLTEQTNYNIQNELPYGWRAVMSADSRIYYQNDITKETQWEKPLSTTEEQTNYNIQNELPYGWRAIMSADSRIYYQNDITKETQWEKPLSTTEEQKYNIKTTETQCTEEQKYNIKKKVPQQLTNELIKDSVKILTDAFSSQFNHGGAESFDINDYIYIHGGACRDILLNNHEKIKDIDLSVDLNEIHKHAAKCDNIQCTLANAYNNHKNKYVEIWKMYLRSVPIWKRSRSRIHNPEERESIELLAMSILHEFVISDSGIINTKYLLKNILTNQNFVENCDTIIGPKSKTMNLLTYTIYLRNGVDLDIMDCSIFISYYQSLQMLKKLNDIKSGKVVEEQIEKRVKSASEKHSNCFLYPITHSEHLKYVDCTFNAIYIKLSSVINTNINTWKNKLIEPYEKIEESHNDINAINDLKQSIIRPYYDSARNVECTDKRIASEGILGSIASNVDSGQAEFLIFRIIKNSFKIKDSPKPIYVSSKYCDVLNETYYRWFNVDKLNNEFVYNKNSQKYENKLEKVLRHTFAHNYFKNNKIPKKK